MTQAAIHDRRVPTRRMSFEDSLGDVPRHFAADGDLILSHLAASLSAVFPDGEEFFVRSVRHYRSQVIDPDLKREVAGFIGQEAMHGREHRAFNDRLAELGYPTKRIERITDRILRTRERLLSPVGNLAVTAALEHFTATLAELVLTSEATRALFGHPAVRDLFVWHALEESEHKAVAFDVYRAIGGTERTRVITMNILRFGFVVFMTANIAASLAGDPTTYRPGNLRRSWRAVRRSPLLSRDLWRQLKAYNRPGFHPEDRSTTELVEHWRRELFGEHGSLNDKLVSSAA